MSIDAAKIRWCTACELAALYSEFGSLLLLPRFGVPVPLAAVDELRGV